MSVCRRSRLVLVVTRESCMPFLKINSFELTKAFDYIIDILFHAVNYGQMTVCRRSNKGSRLCYKFLVLVMADGLTDERMSVF